MNKTDQLRLKIQSNQISAMFQIVINVLKKYSDNLYQAQNFNTIFSPFIFCRYLSMSNNLLAYAEYLQTVYSTSKLTNQNFYKLAYALIPKQGNSFIKYIKKKQKKNKSQNKQRINNKNDIRNNLMDL